MVYREDVARPYNLKRRAESADDTRRRIIDATIELHQTIGPTATTITEIAERAKVGRVTVYRHFPDDAALSQACSGLYMRRNPLPDVEVWAAITDPDERIRVALAAAYAYHRRTEAMFSHVLADAREHPAVVPYHEFWSHAADVLMAGRKLRGTRRRQTRAAIALALSFDTWRTLVRDGELTDARAIEVALRLV